MKIRKYPLTSQLYTGLNAGANINWKRLLQGIISSLFLWLFVTLSAQAALTNPIPGKNLKLLSINAIKENSAKQVLVTLTFSKKVAFPHTISTKDLSSLVLDFTGADNALKNKNKTFNLNYLKGYNAVQAEGKTRVTLQLAKATEHAIRLDKNKVLVTLANSFGSQSALAIKNNPKKMAAIPSAKPFNGIPELKSETKLAANTNASNKPEKEAKPQTEVKLNTIESIKLKKGSNGSGQVVIKLANPNAQVNFNKQKDQLTVEISNSQLGSKIAKEIDAAKINSPITSVTPAAYKNNVLMNIAVKQSYNFLSYEAKGNYVIEIKPIRTKKSTESLNAKHAFSPGYKGKRLSLNFQNIKIRSVLQLLAEFSGLNIVVSDSVKGDITLRLNNVPWDQALDIILDARSLGKRRVGNVIMVAPAAEIAAREQQQLAAQKKVTNLEPLRSELIQINYGKAEEMADLLRGGQNGRPLLSPRGGVSVDIRTNTMWVEDTPAKIREIRNFIHRLDIPVRQVLIEARVVNVDRTFEHELGIRWGITAPKSISGSLLGANNVQLLRGNTLAGTGSVSNLITDVAKRLNVNLPVSTKNFDGAGKFGIALGKIGGNALLDLELSAFQSDGDLKILASPRIITANQKEAVIEQGQEIPYQEATSSGATSVSFKDAVLRLLVTPQITPDNRLVLNLQVNQDEVGAPNSFGVPAINTRQIHTQVLVNNGETIVLGGIYQKKQENVVERVPFLGDLPIIGFLFRHTQKMNRNQELLIFVTPKIIMQRPFRETKKYAVYSK